MIVYNATKEQFNNDVKYNLISDKILQMLQAANIHAGEEAEYRSWQNSLNFMRNILDDNEIPNDCEVAIEYQIPRTSKRVDFIICGADKDNHDNVIVVELKQWDKVEKVADEMLHSVKAYTGGAVRIVSHPSYQAYSYAVFIRNSSECVQDEDIKIIPCAYLHNYEEKYLDQLDDEIFKTWYDEAPFFIKTQAIELNKFIKKYICKKSSDKELLKISQVLLWID